MRPTLPLLAAASVVLFCAASARAADPASGVETSREAARMAADGAPATLTGAVRLDPMLAQYPSASRVEVGSVAFAPNARANGHTRPASQILVVTAGLGWMQRDGGPVREIGPGDVVWIPPGVRHWHGA